VRTYRRFERLGSQVRGIIGCGIDLYHVACSDLPNPHSYTKYQAIASAQRRTGASIFLEAGTFLGITAARCAGIFEQVYTVELDAKLAQRATHYLSPLHNVNVIRGDALQIIPMLLENDRISNVILFLDGHFSGGITACGDIPEPAVEMLPSIAPYQSKIQAIIVDDFRTFGTVEGYPRKSELIASAEKYFIPHGFSLNVFLDMLILERH
jgi:hypothetical protein